MLKWKVQILVQDQIRALSTAEDMPDMNICGRSQKKETPCRHLCVRDNTVDRPVGTCMSMHSSGYGVVFLQSTILVSKCR